MDKDLKMLKISTIVKHMKEKIQRENKTLCEQNLHSEQKPFDEGAAVLSLIYCTDKEINKAYDMVTN